MTLEKTIKKLGTKSWGKEEHLYIGPLLQATKAQKNDNQSKHMYLPSVSLW